MLDISLIPDDVLEAIRNNRQCEDEDIERMTPREAFDAFCNWHGLLDWSGTLIKALDSIRAAEED
jgi:hypothetical protein